MKSDLTIPIDEITIPKRRREPDEDRVGSIARSIQTVGLLNPITLNGDRRLIAGRTRLQAAKKLEWSEIPVRIIDADDLHAELAEIVENVERSNLSALEEGQSLKRMKEIYLALNPETKPATPKELAEKRWNPPENVGRILCFASDTAQKAGKSKSNINRSIAVAEKLTPATQTQIAGTKVADSKTELKRLADLPAKQQEKVARAIGSEKAKTVAEAKKIAGVDTKKPQQGQQKQDPRIWREIEESLGKALNRVDRLHESYPNVPLHKTLIRQIKQAMSTLESWKESQ